MKTNVSICFHLPSTRLWLKCCFPPSSILCWSLWCQLPWEGCCIVSWCIAPPLHMGITCYEDWGQDQLSVCLSSRRVASLMSVVWELLKSAEGPAGITRDRWIYFSQTQIFGQTLSRFRSFCAAQGCCGHFGYGELLALLISIPSFCLLNKCNIKKVICKTEAQAGCIITSSLYSACSRECGALLSSSTVTIKKGSAIMQKIFFCNFKISED